MKYTLTNILTKRIYNTEDYTKYEEITIEDRYAPMNWDDFINMIGYLAEGHKGYTVSINIRAEEESDE